MTYQNIHFTHFSHFLNYQHAKTFTTNGHPVPVIIADAGRRHGGLQIPEKGQDRKDGHRGKEKGLQVRQDLREGQKQCDGPGRRPGS